MRRCVQMSKKERFTIIAWHSLLRREATLFCRRRPDSIPTHRLKVVCCCYGSLIYCTCSKMWTRELSSSRRQTPTMKTTTSRAVSYCWCWWCCCCCCCCCARFHSSSSSDSWWQLTRCVEGSLKKTPKKRALNDRSRRVSGCRSTTM